MKLDVIVVYELGGRGGREREEHGRKAKNGEKLH